jgi:DNA ligase D-like protein (predicted ligase)
MLAETARGAFDGDEWGFELKWDGYRAIAFLFRSTTQTGPFHREGTRLQSRRLGDLTGNYPELARLHLRLNSQRAILDGEIVAFRDGRPDFQALQGGAGPVCYVAFDILELDGVSLLQQPLRQRRTVLRQHLSSGTDLLHSEMVGGAGIAFHRAVAAQGLEGIMAKRLASPYRPGRRSGDWLKIRNTFRILAVAAGYTEATDARPLGALVLAVVDSYDRLTYAGNAGTGFGGVEGAELLRDLGPPAVCPLSDGEPSELRGRVTWVRPELVVEVEGLQWTRQGRLRHPVYRGRRPDKEMADCRAPGALTP